MPFPCVQCGACCRVAGLVPELAHLDRGDGGCMHLTPDNLCAIYEERPRLCRVDEMCSPALTVSEWYERNLEMCERLHLHVYGQPLEWVQ